MSTAYTVVIPGFAMIAILAAEWRFSACLPGYAELFRIKLCPPLRFFFGNFFHGRTIVMYPLGKMMESSVVRNDNGFANT